MSDRILFVDDDVNLLNGMRRALRKRFDLVTAAGGCAALDTIELEGPFAVVIADMRMPGMDGIEVLRSIAEISPDTVRIMLTGNADQETAVEAINTGHIFRFLNKPCDSDRLARVIDDALHQHHLVTAEKTLLEQTLAGSVKVLTDVLALTKPDLFGRALTAKSWAEIIARKMRAPKVWEIGLAAMLAPIGEEAVPPLIQQKLVAAEELLPEEQEIVDRTPEFARDLITNIPRLNGVADIVYFQDRGFDGHGFPQDGPSGDKIPLGSRILYAVKALLRICGGTTPTERHLRVLRENWQGFDPAVLTALAECTPQLGGMETKVTQEIEQDVKTQWLRAGDRLMGDLLTEDGRLVLRAGSQLTDLMVARLRNFRRMHDFIEPVRVRRDVA